MISFLSLVQKMSCNFQGKTQTLEIRCKKVSSKAKLNEKKTKFTELRSKVLLASKAMRSANSYGSYAKTPEFRVIPGSGNTVNTVRIPLR